MGAIDIAWIEGRILVLKGWVADAAEPAGATFDVRVNGISLPAEPQRFARRDLYSVVGDYAAEAGVRLRVKLLDVHGDAVTSLEVQVLLGSKQAHLPIDSRVTTEELKIMANAITGRDGYLFLSNDTNGSLDQISGKMPLSERQAFEIALAHETRRSFARQRLDAAYLHLLVPSKEIVLAHLLPDDVRVQAEGLTPVNSYFEAQPDAAQISFYRPNLLRKLHETQPAFSRTDTHWTHAAALTYLKAALKHHGQGAVAARLEQLLLRRDQQMQLGDLGEKINQPPEQIEFIAPARHSANLYVTNGLINEGCVRVYKNPVRPADERLLFLRDSTGAWLLDFVAELFGEVVAIHCADFDYYFIDKYKSSVILFCQIERFFVRCPKNNIIFRKFVANQETQKGARNSSLDYLDEIINSI